MKHKFQIAPSILSADILQLTASVKQVEENGASYIHVDVMDGHFVPNLTFGTGMVKALKKITALPLDVHLMITNPDDYIEAYFRAGADILTVHQEACVHLHRTVQNIRQKGMKAGVSLNPATPLSTVENILDDIDLLLIMSVNPGFGGQQFIPHSLEKIKQARKMIDASGNNILLEVDGGINVETIGSVVEAGADVLVAGNAVFGQKDIPASMKSLTAAASKA